MIAQSQCVIKELLFRTLPRAPVLTKVVGQLIG